ncbi:type III pantothenate kinase [Patescibacteria group bacterium]|nr:type III pantothenate kinase [Patescibacteria group bacterium]
MCLLVDMGNTRLKWAVLDDSNVLNMSALLNESLNESVLFKHWQTLKPPRQLFISCVSANRYLDCVKKVALSLWLNIDIVCVHSQTKGFGVKNAYEKPESLGVDRWLALIAARNLYDGAVCVVDCGTAITIDLLTAEGLHLGGFISAGIGLMKQSLAHGTNGLPLVDSSHGLNAACSTKAAIHSGTVLAAVGLIEKVLARQSETFMLVLTGGDAELIAPLLNVKSHINKELVLHGLAMMAHL